MPVSHHFYKEGSSNLAKTGSPYEDLGGFLQSNINSESTIHAVLDKIGQLQNGDLESGAWRFDLNKDSLVLTPSNALIEPLYATTKALVVPIEDFVALLNDWRIFIRD